MDDEELLAALGSHDTMLLSAPTAIGLQRKITPNLPAWQVLRMLERPPLHIAVLVKPRPIPPHVLRPLPATPAGTLASIDPAEALRARFGKPFTPAELLRLGASLPEGPTAGRCENCTARGSYDMYCWQQRILCGDCRFEARHGYRPGCDRQPLSPGRELDDEYEEDLPETKFNLKMKHWYTPLIVPDARYAELLLEIEAGQCVE